MHVHLFFLPTSSVIYNSFPIIDNKQKCVSSCRKMNELCNAENLWIEVSNTWIEIKKHSPPPNGYMNKAKGKGKTWRENETKNKIWSVWHIYKTESLSARHWWIFLQDKNGNPVSKNNLLCCRPVWFSYTTGIQTPSLSSTFLLRVSQRRKSRPFC